MSDMQTDEARPLTRDELIAACNDGTIPPATDEEFDL